MIAISETKSIAISEYENGQLLTTDEQKFKEIMSSMMLFMTAAHEVHSGEECWSIKK